MNALRTENWTKEVLAALLLCSLLFQIQTVFACQMMDHSGPIEYCCCADKATNKNAEKTLDGHSACCDISNELTLKADMDKDEPVAIFSHTSLDPPQATLVFFLVTLWPEHVQSQSSLFTWDLNTNPGHPGTHTYLSTLRLRI